VLRIGGTAAVTADQQLVPGLEAAFQRLKSGFQGAPARDQLRSLLEQTRDMRSRIIIHSSILEAVFPFTIQSLTPLLPRTTHVSSEWSYLIT
jgi:hypothetical protein